MVNEANLADHHRTIFHCAEDAPHSRNGYWLTKRRDGRSDNWMIARYQPRNRSIVYRSCKTTDLGLALGKLEAFAGEHPAGVTPPRSRPSEKVYFLQAATGQIKIGIAGDVEKRLAGIRTMSPVPIELVAVTDGGQPVEFGYHRRFATHRLHGEWFAPHPDILAEIARLTRPATIEE